MAEPIKVLIVDDSRLFRSALEQALSGQPDIKVVGSVFNGVKALEFIRQCRPDVVTLDVEMPCMDGLEVLQHIQSLIAEGALPRTLAVVMVSAITRRGADITVKALEAGAFDIVAKPSGSSPEANVLLLRDEVLAKLRAAAGRQPATARPMATRVERPSTPAVRSGPIRGIVIGASTGGPRALTALLPELTARVALPILIVQHMPAGFTGSLAESLARKTGKNVIEATDQMPLESGAVYIAPGGRHLVIRSSGTGLQTGLNDQPPENGCRPSADVLFRSAAAAYGNAAAAIILTGMGRDGTAGLGAVKRAGGYVVAQDEASSVVWGMPGSAYEAGVTDDVLPLDQIAGTVAALVQKGRRN